jgi:hypothetical protein
MPFAAILQPGMTCSRKNARILALITPLLNFDNKKAGFPKYAIFRQPGCLT